MTAPPHSRKYYRERVTKLRSDIEGNLPQIDKDEFDAFVSTCKDFQDAKENWKKEDNEETRALRGKALKTCIETAKTILDKLDILIDEATLLECTVIGQVTPKVLAEFVESDPETNGPLLDKFLKNPQFMKDMILNGGAARGKWIECLQIYSKILQSNDEKEQCLAGLSRYDDPVAETGPTSTDIHQKLALATALEFANPVPNFGNVPQATGFVDPVERFWHFVHAHERGELDEHFESFSPWELRMVVDCQADNDQMQWGRDHLRNYRPDQCGNPRGEEHWRYLDSVLTDFVYQDSDGPITTYPGLLAHNGMCGAYAWYGRFIAKTFGIPSWGVRQPGHAAPALWTPTKGWMVFWSVAGDWESATWFDHRFHGIDHPADRMRSGRDFIREAKARDAVTEDEYYQKVCLLDCVGQALGEKLKESPHHDHPWRTLALLQRLLLAESYTPKERPPAQAAPRRPPANEVEQIEVNEKGGIIIPAASFTQNLNPTMKAFSVKSFNEEGWQLHLKSDGAVEYKLPDTVSKGKYMLWFRLVTVHKMHNPLQLTVEGEDGVETYSLEVPYTNGNWERSKPVEVQLGPEWTLKFTRPEKSRGLTIKRFLCKPCEE